MKTVTKILAVAVGAAGALLLTRAGVELNLRLNNF